MEDIIINEYSGMKGYYYVRIITDEGTFEISYQPNLDIYWQYRPKESLLDCPCEKVFNITKENYYLYSSIEELYNAITSNMPYSNGEYDNDFKGYVHYISSNYLGLFTNDEITWYSDDFCMNEASSLGIKKIDDIFKIKFTKSKVIDDLTFSVRFRNSGSRYDPYNVAFMNMYDKLLKYDYQIHIEEILYKQKKLIK